MAVGTAVLLVWAVVLVGPVQGGWTWPWERRAPATPRPTMAPPTTPEAPQRAKKWSVQSLRGKLRELREGLEEGERVMTTHGPVRGVRDDKVGAKIWWGIPFAAPPVGRLRLAPPVPPTPWTEEWKATAPSPWCPQMLVNSRVFLGQEDCLYLSVYAPATAKPGDKLPVMVWIYGGGFAIGDEHELGWYDGRNLAVAEGVVVVAVNYRLNNIGFLALRSLLREHGTTGTYGLLDQQLGLRWVQANIEEFGGDRERVTLFGESAGGHAVAAHMAMPSSRGLFHGAIVQSGLLDGEIPWPTLERAAEFGEAVARKVGCGHVGREQVACLRGLPLGKLLNPLLELGESFEEARGAGVAPKLMPVMTYWPVVDGQALPYSPVEAARRGLLADVPLMVGTTKDEGSIFAAAVPLVVPQEVRGWVPMVVPLTRRGLRLTVEHIFDDAGVREAVYERYEREHVRWGDLLGPSRAVAELVRDYVFACPARRLVRTVRGERGGAGGANRTSPAYLYHFTYDMDDSLTYAVLGDIHTAEISYVFGNPWLVQPLFAWTDEDRAVSRRVQRYWANFARNVRGSGSPSDGDCLPEGCSPDWPAYGDQPQQQRHLVIDFPLRVEGGYYDDVCDFWDSHPASLRLR